MTERYKLDRAHALLLYKEMLRIRRFEEKCAELYSEGLIRGFLHLYIGEEAVAVGVMQALDSRDHVIATYREHGQALARGVPATAIMAEMFGRQDGCCLGRGGSMHIFDRERNFYGGNAIVAGGLPLAVGLAQADKMQGRDAISVCFFGDGAVAEGEFHECMNLAALWELPVLFLCENNLYAMGSAVERVQSEPDVHRKAEAYRMAACVADGMDVISVLDATRHAVETIRTTGKPMFVECRTYRFRPHSMFDPELYRAKAEVEAWRNHDPLITLPAFMRSAGLAGDEEFKDIDAEVAAEIDEAVAFARDSELEPIEDLTRHVYRREVVA